VRPAPPATTASPVIRASALTLVVVGAVLVVGGVFADPLGLTWGGEGFGWKQLLATIAGLILLLLGASWLVQVQAQTGRPRRRETFQPRE
jgi:hypothetical protein